MAELLGIISADFRIFPWYWLKMPPYLAKSCRETELRWSPPKRTPCAILVSVFASQDIRCPDWCVCEQCRRGWWETGRTSWRLICPMTNLPLAWCDGRCRQPTCIHPHSGFGTPRSTDGNIARQAREADTLRHCRLHARNSEFSFYFSHTLEWEISLVSTKYF